MKILIITQDEPFYLTKNLRYLLNILPSNIKVVGSVVSSVSPFGKKESFLKKAKKTYDIFGWKFFTYYAIKYVISKLKNDLGWTPTVDFKEALKKTVKWYISNKI